MKIDRHWIVMFALATFVFATGCPKKPIEAPPEEPEPTVAPPTVDVPEEPAEPVDPVPPPVPKSIQEINEELRASGLIGDVFYDYDKYDLRSEAVDRLAKNAEYMNSAEGSKLSFTIEGHCDERGTNEYNIALGQSRATSALDYLESLGVDRRRFKTISYGEEKPNCEESNESCWQQNRRATFIVSSQSDG